MLQYEVDQKAAAVCACNGVCVFINNWCGYGSIAATCELDGVPHPACKFGYTAGWAKTNPLCENIEPPF